MEEIINNIFLTGVLVTVLIVCVIKFRGEFEVSKFEKYVSVLVFLSGVIVCLISALCLIWI